MKSFFFFITLKNIDLRLNIDFVFIFYCNPDYMNIWWICRLLALALSWPGLLVISLRLVNYCNLNIKLTHSASMGDYTVNMPRYEDVLGLSEVCVIFPCRWCCSCSYVSLPETLELWKNKIPAYM